MGSSWFVGYVYLRWVLLGGCLALLLCAGVRCESWYVSCVDFRWAATGSLAALIFVGFFKLRWFSLGCSRYFCFALASIARVGLQGALVFVMLFSASSASSASSRPTTNPTKTNAIGTPTLPQTMRSSSCHPLPSIAQFVFNSGPLKNGGLNDGDIIGRLVWHARAGCPPAINLRRPVVR